MREKDFILAIDQGTTGSRAILYDEAGKPIRRTYKEFTQYYPKPGWVEHDAEEIWRSVYRVIERTIKPLKNPEAIAAIGITNQRETVVLWDRKTGKPVHPAIVWQDRRTAKLCQSLKQRGYEKKIRAKTGLVIDPYFSASKLQWIFRRNKHIYAKAKSGDLCFGTIDAWLVWKLTGGKSHATDYTNASRTLLFNIKTLRWDDELLDLFGIPPAILPRVQASGSFFGKTAACGNLPDGIPIQAVIGDQQAALYGQGCYAAGNIKNTYGTGCFVVMHLGKNRKNPPPGLLETVACDKSGQPAYAFEGAIFIAGAAMQWLRDGLHFFKHAKDSEKMIRSLKDSGEVTVIPAFVGLGSPYWNAEVRGTINGITRGTTKAHIIRATLESIAHQTADVIELMRSQSGLSRKELRVDGGATSNRFLMQFQADLLNCPVWVSGTQESTAWGAAKLAGYQAGLWKNLEFVDQKKKYVKYGPRMPNSLRKKLRIRWLKAVHKLLQIR